MTMFAYIPRSIIRILAPVAFTWALVAAIEASSFLIIALAIIGQYSVSVVLGMAAITVFITVLVARSGFFAGARLVGELYDTVGDAVSKARLSWFTEDNRALLQEAVTRNIPGFMRIPAHQLQTYIHAPLLSVFLVLAIGVVGGATVMAFAACLVSLSFLIQYRALTRLSQVDKGRAGLEASANNSSLELVEHIELLRTACGTADATHRIEQSWLAQEGAFTRTNRSAGFATFFSVFASALPALGVSIFLYVSGPVEGTEAFCLVFLAMRSGAPLRDLALAGIGINDQLAAIKNYRKIMSAPALPDISSSGDVSLQHHTINLSHVTHASVLRNLSCSIPQGERVLITGPSGSGKSTLIGLLMRFDDPDQGQIMIGDQPLGRIPHKQLAKCFSYVPQNPIIFTGTIASNIRLADPEESDEAVEKVARQAGLSAVLDRSELGINQPVGHQGKALSGGERQRVAIARALLKKAPVLILDEATSALDAQTEEEVAATLRSLESTLIIATHGRQEIWNPDRTIELTPN